MPLVRISGLSPDVARLQNPAVRGPPAPEKPRRIEVLIREEGGRNGQVSTPGVEMFDVKPGAVGPWATARSAAGPGMLPRTVCV
jgi:hypothetical protein